MEVTVISKEKIKPSSQLHHLEPFKLSALDQLTPLNYYGPIILFYENNGDMETSKLSAQLKASLSKTLTTFYFLTGSMKDNCTLHNFHEGGAYFVEARAKGRLDQFLQYPQMEVINHFLPIEPFVLLQDTSAVAPELQQVAVQLTFFDCGGLSIGVCLSHMIMDGSSFRSFLRNWAANTRCSCEEEGGMNPSLFEASSLFPPQKELPLLYDSLMEKWCANINAELKTLRRFVFDAEVIAALQALGTSELVQSPTKSDVVTAFIWKCAMAASTSISGSPRPSSLGRVINIRGLTTPSSSNSIGNLILNQIVRYEASDKGDLKFHEMVALARKCVKKIDREFLSRGSVAVFDYIVEFVELCSEEDATLFNFSDLRSFHFEGEDFGWGKPVWVGLCGQAKESNSNYTFFFNGNNGAIEAWMALEEDIMERLELDPEFLAFASPNPAVICINNQGIRCSL